MAACAGHRTVTGRLRLDEGRQVEGVAREFGDPGFAVGVVAGAPPLAAGARTARALARLRELRPRARVTLRELDRAEVVTGVAAGGLDVGLVDGAAASGDPLRLPEAGPLHAVRCAEEDLTVVLAEDHPPAAGRRREVRLAGPHGRPVGRRAGRRAATGAAASGGGREGFRAGARHEGPEVWTVTRQAGARSGAAAALRGRRGGRPASPWCRSPHGAGPPYGGAAPRRRGRGGSGADRPADQGARPAAADGAHPFGPVPFAPPR